MGKAGKNTLILSILFFGPLLFYLFLLTGTNNFAKLPTLTEKVAEPLHFETESGIDTIRFEDNISILCFLGKDPSKHKTNALNLNEKIYKHFDGFRGFQFVVILPEGAQDSANSLKKELGAIYNIDKWYFLYGEANQVERIFNSLQTSYELDKDLYNPNAFIIDKSAGLRGRDNDEDVPGGIRYGYNAESISTVHQEMVDDVKVVIAEYRMALKKNKREI